MFVAELESRLDETCFSQVFPRRKFAHTRDIQINGDLKEVSFSAIQDEHKRQVARDLLNDRYEWRGYGSSHDLRFDNHHTTFVAEIDQEIVGTMTLGVDSDRGLAIDKTFAEVVDEVRQEPGARICELTKLAFEENVRSKDVLAGLFHMAFIYGTTRTDCTDLFIEVNPRHVRFYEKMLGFRRIGPMAANLSVGAPSCLMRIAVSQIRDQIRQMAGAAAGASDRSLYPHFFPPEEEGQVRRLLQSMRPSRAYSRLPLAADGLDARIEEVALVSTARQLVSEHMRSAA